MRLYNVPTLEYKNNKDTRSTAGLSTKIWTVTFVIAACDLTWKFSLLEPTSHTLVSLKKRGGEIFFVFETSSIYNMKIPLLLRIHHSFCYSFVSGLVESWWYILQVKYLPPFHSIHMHHFPPTSGFVKYNLYSLKFKVLIVCLIIRTCLPSANEITKEHFSSYLCLISPSVLFEPYLSWALNQPISHGAPCLKCLKLESWPWNLVGCPREL